MKTCQSSRHYTLLSRVSRLQSTSKLTWRFQTGSLWKAAQTLSEIFLRIGLKAMICLIQCVRKRKMRRFSAPVTLSRCMDEDSSKVLWLKTLDPEYMRIRQDCYKNIFGYAQLNSYPPVVFDPEEIYRTLNNVSSWFFENAYGTSSLRSAYCMFKL